MSKGDGPLGGKCARCGQKLPAKQGRSSGRRRIYCSKNCQRYSSYSRKGKTPRDCGRECRNCGKMFVPQKRRGGVSKFCSDACRRKPARRCKNCEKKMPPGTSPYAIYCSAHCRVESNTIKKPCEFCGVTFTARRCPSNTQRFCSQSCVQRYRWKHRVGIKKPKVYECLYCGKEFGWRPSASAYKFCSRDCAFEARKEKHPSAFRPKQAWAQLAAWFVDWGGDQFPTKVRCDCGELFDQNKRGSPTACGECLKACRRDCLKSARKAEFEKTVQTWSCEKCGSGRGMIARGGMRVLRRCLRCVFEAKRGQKRRAGTNFRSRCKRHGVPYTPIEIKSVHEKSGWKCYLCGVELLREYTLKPGTRTPDGRSPTIDHVIPLACGPGSPGHVIENVKSCCWRCNCCIKSKKDMKLALDRPPAAT